eukprot:tig00020911_g15720.t1
MRLVLEGRHLAKKDFFGLGKSDRTTCSRGRAGAASCPSSSPSGSPARPTSSGPPDPHDGEAVQRELDRPLKIEVFDYDSVGAHDFIGACTTTARQLLEFPREGLPLVDPRRRQEADYRESGRVHVNSVSVERSFTFLDFVAGGCEISSSSPSARPLSSPLSRRPPISRAQTSRGATGTAEPGLPPLLRQVRAPRPLPLSRPAHPAGGPCSVPPGLRGRGQPAVPNEYEQAITPSAASWTSTTATTSTRLRLRRQLPRTSHCFALNGNRRRRRRCGRAAIAAQGASQAAQKYSILLILTDGQINDLERTKDELVAASALPSPSSSSASAPRLLLHVPTPALPRASFVPFSQFRGGTRRT